MKIQAVRGTRDILPDEIPVWHALERAAHDLLGRYGYREIRTPVFEETELFARGIGAETDIVSKEMYTFDDRDGSSLTLRPEATAGIVRAVIEHNLMNTDPALKVYALGPMFRRERPQKGRYRQFHQLDVEAFGFTSPTIDAEMIELAIGVPRGLRGPRARAGPELRRGRELPPGLRGDAPRRRFGRQASALCGDCQRRAETNPLRVLDCKVPGDQEIIDALPKIADHLCAECRDHFAEVRRQLEVLGIPYRLSHRLVRGLDYYVRTTFEVLERRARGPEQRPRRRAVRRPRPRPRGARRGRDRLRGGPREAGAARPPRRGRGALRRVPRPADRRRPWTPPSSSSGT